DIGPLFGDRADGVERRGLRVERVGSNRFVIGAEADCVARDTKPDVADLDDVPARGESGEEEAAGAVRHQSAARGHEPYFGAEDAGTVFVVDDATAESAAVGCLRARDAARRRGRTG